MAKDFIWFDRPARVDDEGGFVQPRQGMLSYLGDSLIMMAAGAKDPTAVLEYKARQANNAFRQWQAQQPSEIDKLVGLLSPEAPAPQTNTDGPIGGPKKAFENSRAGLSPTGIGLNIPPSAYSQVEGSLAGKLIGQTPESKVAQDLYKTVQGKNIDLRAKVNQSKLSNQFNTSLVVGNLSDLSDLYVAAHSEGGAGSKYKKMYSDMAAAGWFGEEEGDKFDDSGAFAGKKFEIISKMFPMLTQQIGKEGSVRLIQSVFEKLGQTLPSLNTPKKVALKQMKTTIQSLYRIQKALDQINLDDYSLSPEEYSQSFEDKMKSIASNVEITGGELEALKALQGRGTKSLEDYINSKSGGTEIQSIDAELEEINKQLEAFND